MNKCAVLALSLLPLLAVSQVNQNNNQEILWSREHINHMMETGQFDKVAHDAWVESIHQPATFGGGERTSACDCYTDPDDTYTHIPNNQFAPNALDGYFGPVNLPFTFNHWGTNVNSLHINTKGTLSIGGPNTVFIPVGFPTTVHNLIAGYWADLDIRPIGDIYYKLTDNALFVNYVDVGYYNFHDDKTVTFQIIISNGTYEPIGLGNNVAFCYETMEWACGDESGAGGAGIPATTNAGGTVGSNRPNNGHIQFGRFAALNANYNGPYGANDGVFWLNGKSFTFNTAIVNSNIPPIVTENPSCDTIQVCINDVYNLTQNIIAPESNQQVTITVNSANAQGWAQVTNTSGTNAVLTGTFTGSFGNLGFHTLTITGTDNGTPPLSVSVQYVFEVIPVEVPVLTISGDLIFCGGNNTTITASTGFDFYYWTEDGCFTNECEHDNGGTYTVTGDIQGCTATTSFQLTELPPDLLVFSPNPLPDVCSLDSALVCVTGPGSYVSYSVEVYVPSPPNGLSFQGTIYGPDNESCTYLGPGTYQYFATDTDGCTDQKIIVVDGIDATVPDDSFSGSYCEGPQDVEFGDAYINAVEGPLWFYMFQGYTGLGWNSGYLQLVINGDTLTNIFTCNGPFCTINYEITYGQYLQVIYVPGPAEIDGNGLFTGSPNNLNIINCGGANIVFNTQTNPNQNLVPGIIWEGWSACNADPALGSWDIVSGPGGAFSNMNEFNSVFTPDDYGVYEVCFTDVICDQLRCYDLVFSEPPTLSLSEDGPIEMCAGDEVVVTAAIDSPLNDAVLTWNAGLTGNPVTLNQAGIFVGTAANDCGSVSDQVEIVIPAVPDVVLPGALDGCTGETFTLDPVAEDNPDFSYTWTGPGVTGSTESQVTVSQSGTYSVMVQDGCNGTTVQTVITLESDPGPALPAVVSGCNSGVTLDPIAVNDPSFTYSWTGPGVTGNTNPEVDVVQGGNYSVTVSSACGSATANTNVVIVPNPTATLPATLLDCDGSAVLDPVVADDPSFDYFWTGPGVAGSAAPTVTATQTGTYQVTVSNECGQATASSSVTIGSSTTPVLPPSVNDCNGGPITLTVQADIGTYSWSPGGQTTNSILVTQSGTYTVTVTDECGNSSATSLVSIGLAPSVNFPMDTLSICPGIIELACEYVEYSGSINSYTWTKGAESFSSSECPEFRSEDVPSEMLETGVAFTVSVTGACGTDSDTFILFPEICEVDEFNVFTPNGDGVNDFFILGGADAFKDVKFKVFNRWGTLVFESGDFGSTPGWDGANQPTGTYYYIAELPNGDELNGSFTLLR